MEVVGVGGTIRCHARMALKITNLGEKLTSYSQVTLYLTRTSPDVVDSYKPEPHTSDRIISDVQRSFYGLDLRVNETRRQEFSFVDIFAGIGGMRLGFEAAGGACVFTCEWNKYSQQTYRANFGEDDIGGDIREIPEDAIPPHDVLVAGFPCQPFSIAGVSKKNALNEPHGFACQAQGTLFFDLARLIAYHKPRAFLLENVKNLVNHDRGRTFGTIKSILEDELQYKISPRVIDARHWVPQHRERIFIAGFRDDCDFDLMGMPLPGKEETPILRSIIHPENGTEIEEPHYTIGPLATVDERYTLSEHLWEYLTAYAEKHRAKGNGFGYGLVSKESVARTLSARYYKDGSEILVGQENDLPRRLTPRECSRLMGFDNPGRADFNIPVSDTQAYKQFGNAVAVPVVESIAIYMKPYII